MRYPLDRICVRSGILCPICQRKVDTGIVKEYEIPIMKSLMEIEEQIKELRDQGEYVRSYKYDSFIVILIRGIDDMEILERLSKKLSSKLRARVRVVNYSSEKKRIVEQLIYPASLLGINTLWLPDGSEQTVIRISRQDQRFLAGKRKYLEEILSELLGRPVRIRFE